MNDTIATASHKVTEPGLYDLSNETYHAHPSISSSQLVVACRSMAHFWANSPLNAEFERTEPTEAMKRGSAVHCFLLEPEVFDKTYLVAPDKRDYAGLLDTIDDLQAFCLAHSLQFKSTMKKPELLNIARPEAQRLGRGIWSDVQSDFARALESAGAIEVKPEARRNYQRMGEALADQDIVFEGDDGAEMKFKSRTLFTAGKPEQSIFWRDPETNLMCRVRPDWLIMTPKLKLIIDFKTTVNADHYHFQSQGEKLLYWMRAAMYVDGVREGLRAEYTRTGQPFTEDDLKFDYLLLAQEYERPFLAAPYIYLEQFIEMGRELYKAKLKQIAACMAQRYWPGYTNKVRSIEVRSNTYSRFPELDDLINHGVSQFNR